MDMENYGEINELSTISTPSSGYRVGILNSDGDEKSKRGDSNESKYGNSGGESDHRGSGDEGELVNDGNEGEWHGSSKLKNSSHEVEYGSFLVWLGGIKKESTHEPCSENSGRVSVGESTISKGGGKLLREDGLQIAD